MPIPYLQEATKAIRAVSKQHDSTGISMRQARVDEIVEEMQYIYECALDVFSDNYGFSRVSREEFIQAFLHLGPLLDSRLFHFMTNVEDVPIAFVYGYRDSPENPTRIVFHTVGVSSKHRGEATVYHLAVPFWEAAVEIGLPAVGGLAKEGRTTFDKCGPANRSYSVLAKKL